MVIYSGNTIEDAIQHGLVELGLTQAEVEIKIVQNPKKGFLGIGKKEAQVQLTKIAQPDAPKDPVDLDVDNGDAHNEEINNKVDIAAVKTAVLEYLSDVIDKMGFAADLTVIDSTQKKFTINIETTSDQESRLIGRHGRTINTLQGLGQIYINRLNANNLDLTLDTADYRFRRKEALIKLAEKTARNAIATGKPVYLNSMPSFERKILHNALAYNEHVATYSTGREPNRVVVVDPR